MVFSGSIAGFTLIPGQYNFTFPGDNIVLNIHQPEVPLPAALPLYATGLGLMGLCGWWRRRKAAVVAARS
jgi:hypothetical protein